MRIYLDKQYGLNMSSIEFTPYCKDEIEVVQTITWNKYSLQCIGKNQFKLVTDNPNDFILGSDLLNNEWKIKKYEYVDIPKANFKLLNDPNLDHLNIR